MKIGRLHVLWMGELRRCFRLGVSYVPKQQMLDEWQWLFETYLGFWFVYIKLASKTSEVKG